MIDSTRQPSPGGNSTRAAAWQSAVQARWARLQRLIADRERALEQASGHRERNRIEGELKTLKRAALSIWMDARREGIALTVSGEDLPRLTR